jgi:hypothetical protein
VYSSLSTAVQQITTAHVQPILTGLFRSHGQGWPKVPSGVFDCGLLAFDPKTRQVVLAGRLTGSDYGLA